MVLTIIASRRKKKNAMIEAVSKYWIIESNFQKSIIKSNVSSLALDITSFFQWPENVGYPEYEIILNVILMCI